jgi:hypothetical protein
MIGKTSNPTKRIFAALLTLFVLFPTVCSARCSSQLCATTIPQNPGGSCHHAFAPENSAGINTFAIPCTSGEIVFIAPRSDRYASSTKAAGPTPPSPFLAGAFSTSLVGTQRDSPRHPATLLIWRAAIGSSHFHPLRI